VRQRATKRTFRATRQPHHLDVARSLALEPAARLHPIEIAVDVKFQQNRGMSNGRAVAAELTPSNPSSARSTASTNASITRAALFSPIRSSDAGVGLLNNLVSFMEHKRASHITTELALEWAQKRKSTLPADWARGLSWVRGFARDWSAFDPRTQIPLTGLLPYRPQRARPYIYTEQQIERLLAAERALPAGGPARLETYCLFGLLSVSGCASVRR
jgi:hypothetical protein